MVKLIAKQDQRKLRTYATAMHSCSPTQCKISTTRDEPLGLFVCPASSVPLWEPQQSEYLTVLFME